MDGGGGGDDDVCEYIYNPLMQSYKAMLRLINLIRNSQSSSFNNLQTFNSNNNNNNPFNNISTRDDSLTSSWSFIIFGWLFLSLILFLLRPNSLKKTRQQETNKTRQNETRYHNSRNDDDDDDNLIS